MVNTSATYKTLIANNSIEDRLTAIISKPDGTDIYIDDSYIVSNSVQIEESLFKNNTFGLGNCISSILTAKLLLPIDNLEDATISFQYGIKNPTPVITNLSVFSTTTSTVSSVDVSTDFIPSVVPLFESDFIRKDYVATFTSGALKDNSFNITKTGNASSWTGRDYISFDKTITASTTPATNDNFDIYKYETVSLGWFKILQVKRVDNYVEIVAYDNMLKLDIMGVGYAQIGTPTTINLDVWSDAISSMRTPFCKLRNSISPSNYLELTAMSSDYTFDGWKTLLLRNTSDNLQVSLDDTNKYLIIKLAITTASKNTATNIRNQFISLYNATGNQMQKNIINVVPYAYGSWDTTTTNTGEKSPVLFRMDWVHNLTDMVNYPNGDTTLSVNFSGEFKGRVWTSHWAKFLGSVVRKNRNDSLKFINFKDGTSVKTIYKTQRWKTKIGDMFSQIKVLKFKNNNISYSVSNTNSSGKTLDLKDIIFLKNENSTNITSYLQNIVNSFTGNFLEAEVSFTGDPSLECGDWVTIDSTDGLISNPKIFITNQVWRYRGAHTITSKIINSDISVSENENINSELSDIKENIIQESGSNYIKYADGTLHCWTRVNLATAIASGGGPTCFVNNTNLTWTFPIPFANTTNLVVTGSMYGANVTVGGVTSFGTSTSIYTYRLWCSSSLANADTRTIMLNAIGKWK